MNNLPKVLESKAIIRFQDCDPFNHLNNSNYLNYFMNHREDMLIDSYDVDIYKMGRKEGKSWVVGSSQIAYLKPALLMEQVTIQSQLIYFTASELYVEMKMFNEDKSQLKALLWSSFVHFNLLKQQREKHTEEFMDLFNKVHNPIDATLFEERLKELKSSTQKA